MVAQSMDSLVSLSKRRGFIFQSNNIYGGLQGVYDFGPLGVELKKNIRESWWSDIVYKNENIFGLDASILTHPLVLNYSGHEETFTDPLVDCKDCKARHRADFINDSKCPLCGSTSLTEPRDFNLMFKTNIGPVADSNNFAYLRPETAQQIFTNFKNIMDSSSPSLPFGIAQIGKAFRNEITPRNFIFRVREFEQMELEYFVKPDDADKALEEWLEQRLNWWDMQGVCKDKLEIYDVPSDELSHYSKKTYDLMYEFPHGKEELEGIANRTDFDLGSHSQNQEALKINAKIKHNPDSKSKLAIQDENGEWFVPYVIEPSAGIERAFLAILNEAYNEESLENGKNRVVLKLKPHLAPVKAAVIPLKKNDMGLVKMATELKNTLQKNIDQRIVLENTGNIGKSYRKHDEIGTPYCITIDFDSLTEGTVTIRNRDTMKQDTVKVESISKHMSL